MGRADHDREGGAEKLVELLAELALGERRVQVRDADLLRLPLE